MQANLPAVLRVMMLYPGLWTQYAEVYALREPHPPDSNHHGNDNTYQDEPSSENMRLRDDITKPFSDHGEYDFEASEHKPATYEVMVDADEDVHDCIGESNTMVSSSMEQSQPTATATDVDAEWEIDGDLMGKEVIDGEVYYLVPWKPTLVPANRMQNALDLINRFEAQFGAPSDKSDIFPTAAVVATTPRDLDRLARVDEVRVAQAIVAGNLLPRHAVVGRNAAQGVVGPDSPAAAAADLAEPAVVILQGVVQVEGAVPQRSVGAAPGREDASVFKVHVL
ncbi:unnamed protein product [Clonostachys rhizophaga]|uniref:Uncharacterized protein n=1 Tax=Clonostachys rhizophaga TaxID=160324 RepID=A0A9N9YN81_9HYPO|nr:unnamed protein product [Clonostachys rhizophaga]